MFILKSAVWRRNIRFVLWAGVTILALNAVRLAYRGVRPVVARAASPVSFTVFRTEQVFDAAGTLKFTHHYVEAVRSDGSKMWRGTTNDVQSRDIYFANGDMVQTNELAGTKSTFPKKYAGPPSPRDPNGNCATTEEINSHWTNEGTDTVGPYRAVRRVMDVGHGRRLTMWYGVDVGCAVLKQRLEHETGVTEQNLDAIILGEPDRALFQFPASLNELPPSQLFSCQGAACAPLPDDFKQKIDKSYYELRGSPQ
jgi:hypothetical protein